MIDKIQNIKNVPELRFPEFSGEWVERKLGDIGMFTGGGTPDTNEKIYWTGDIPWISSSDIQEYNIHSVNISHYITNHAVLKSATKIIPAKSVLIVSRVGVGKFAVVNREICTSQDFTNLTPQYEDVYYLAYYFTAKANRFVRYSQGTSIKGFTSSDIKSLKFNLSTDIREQKKIANFLMQVDKRIDKLEEKKEKLEEYKKGVMQKIFSQEIRFKDDNGEDFPDWEKKRLGDIGKTYNGLIGKKKEHFGEGELYIQYMQVFSSSYINIENCGFVSIDPKENQNKVRYGDVFFTTSSETPREIGMSSVYIDNINDAYLNSFCFGYRPNSLDVLCPEFSQFIFRSKGVRMMIVKLAQGSTRFNMSKVEFMKQKIYLPTLQEQQKIASFLTQIDRRIIKIYAQIKTNKQFKNGLLQKMYV